MNQSCDDTDTLVVSNHDQTVYVIDDDAEVRCSLHFLLSTAGYESLPFACASDFLENLPTLEAAPILIDIRMPEIDGIEFLAELFKRGVKWPVIAITAHATIPIAVQAIKLGAIDLLEKPLDFEMLEKSLGKATKNLSIIKISAKAQSIARRLFDLLSLRELEVLNLLMAGLPNKVAAHRLVLSVRTVEMHRINALRKLKVKSIAQVINLTTEAGIIWNRPRL